MQTSAIPPIQWPSLFSDQPTAFLKTVKASSECVFDSYLASIIQTGEHDYKPRFLPKRTYTVFGDKIEVRAEKKPLYTTVQKMGFSPHTSTVMISPSVQPPAFLKGSCVPIAGIIFPRKDVLPNRYFLNDGWTTCRSYDHDSLPNAQKYFIKNCQGENPTLFADEKEFEQALCKKSQQPGRIEDYNEALVHTRFSSSCCVAILEDKLEQRWVAIHYAQELSARMKNKKQGEGQNCDEEPVTIVYYLPKSDKHFQVYPENEMAKDIQSAKEIAQDFSRVQKEIDNSNFSFLLVLHDEEGKQLVNKLFTSEIGPEIIGKLVSKKYFYYLDFISEKIGLDWLAKVANSQKVAYLTWCISTGKTLKALKVLKRDDLSLSDHKADNPLAEAMRRYDMQSIKGILERHDAPVNQLSPYGSTCLQEAILMEAQDIFSELLKSKCINVNLKSMVGDTALHLAAQHGHKEMVAALIAAPQINVNLRNSSGRTPKETALRENYLDIVQLFDQKTERDALVTFEDPLKKG